MNLISNAFKFTKSGSVTARLKLVENQAKVIEADQPNLTFKENNTVTYKGL